MAVTASGIFYIAQRDILLNDTAVDLTADTLKMALFTNSITPNFDTDTGYGAAPYNANEVGTATALASVALSNIATNKLKVTSSAVAFPSATFSGARCGVIFDDSRATAGDSVTDPVLILVNFGADFAVTAGVLTVTPNANGWWNHQLV